jgi:hypothetical protein
LFFFCFLFCFLETIPPFIFFFFFFFGKRIFCGQKFCFGGNLLLERNPGSQICHRRPKKFLSKHLTADINLWGWLLS